MTKLLESSWDARQGLAPGRGLWDVGGYGPAAFSSSFGWDPPWAVGREVAGEIGDDFQLVSVPGPRNTGAQGWGGTGVGGALGVLAWAAASLARRARATSDGDPPPPTSPLSRRLRPRQRGTSFLVGKSDLEVVPQEHAAGKSERGVVPWGCRPHS